MLKCPNCSNVLEEKKGSKKICAQIGNPEIAIVTAENPKFCSHCNKYFLNKEGILSSILQIKNNLSQKKSIAVGIYE